MARTRPVIASWLLAAGGACALLGAERPPVIERYTVDVQYRGGGVTQSFPDLGGGTVALAPVDATAFDVKADATVKHPKDGRTFRFRVEQRFRLDGRFIQVVRTSVKELNTHARPHEAEILRILPFAFLVRYLPVPDRDGDRTATLRYRGSSYDLRYRESEKQLEVTLYEGNRDVGKFFLSPGEMPDRRRLARLEKFRIALTAEKLVVNFVVGGS